MNKKELLKTKRSAMLNGTAEELQMWRDEGHRGSILDLMAPRPLDIFGKKEIKAAIDRREEADKQLAKEGTIVIL
jgi:hypothetical protein